MLTTDLMVSYNQKLILEICNAKRFPMIFLRHVANMYTDKSTIKGAVR